MPGCSLWLVPPPSHPLHAILSTLISKTLPSKFPGKTEPDFPPHMTLASNVLPSTYGDDPQTWLDAIPWPAASVRFETVKSEDTFFRRCYLKVTFTGVRDIAGLAWARGVGEEESVGERTESWLEEWTAGFGPHISLI